MGVCWSTEDANWGDSDDDELLGDKIPALNALLKNISAPAMPTISKKQEHRVKHLHSPFTNLSALVARPVPKREMKETPEALRACKKEWTRLQNKPAWDITIVREWGEVCSTAKKKNKKVHVGRVFGFCVEKRCTTPLRPPKPSI